MHLPFLSRPGLARLAAALALALAAGPAPAGLVVRADPDEYLAALLEDFPGIDQPLASAAAGETPCHPDGNGRTHAIIVGAPFGDQVEGTSNDVGLLREVLLFRGVDADRIHPLSGADATFANLAGQAQAVLDQASCGDSVLIHISAAALRGSEIIPGPGLLFDPGGPLATAGSAPAPLPGDPSNVTREGLDQPLETVQDLSPELRRIAASGPFILLAPTGDRHDTLLPAGTLADFAGRLRGRGVHVTVSLDTNYAEVFALEDRQPPARNASLWRNRLTPDGWAADWPDPLPGFAGALTVFYGTGPDELSTEARVQEDGDVQRSYGAFTFHLAAALVAADRTSPEAVARATAPASAGEGKAQKVAQNTSYVFLSTDPTRDIVLESRPPATEGDRFIRILSPVETRDAVPLDEPVLTIEGQVVAPVRTLVVTINGKRAETGPDGSFRHDILLQHGVNRIDIIAITADNTPLLRSMEVTYGGDIAALAGSGTSYALIIANQDYAEGSGLNDLKTPVGDAAAIADLLTGRFGFVTTLALPGGGQRSLILTDATRIDIETALYDLSRVLGERDRLLVFYAGHGYYEVPTDEASWLPADAKANLPFTWLPASAITSALLRIQAGSILVISDSCYSGALLRGETGTRMPSEEDRLRLLTKLASGRSRIVIASGANEPVLDGGGGGHSIFARALIAGLSEMPEEAFSARELFDGFLLPMVAGRAGQEPQYRPIAEAGHETGDMVFARRE